MGRRINQLLALAAIVLATSAAASCQIDREDVSFISTNESPATPQEETIEGIVYSMPVIAFDDAAPETRVTFGDDYTTGLTPLWEETDRIGVRSDENGIAAFSMRSGEGTARAVFTGGGFDLSEGATYSAYFPFSEASSGTLALDWSAQTRTLDNDIDALEDELTLFARATVTDGNANFAFRNPLSVMKLHFSCSSSIAPAQVSLLPTKSMIAQSGSLSLADGILSPSVTSPRLNVGLSGIEDDAFTLWLQAAPADYSAESLAALVTDEGGNLYSGILAGKNMRAGYAYRNNYTLVPWNVSSLSTLLSGTKTSPSSSVYPTGQYSGITTTGDGTFYVVHDKLSGGGLCSMTLSVDNSYNATVSDFTELAGNDGGPTRDPEGVVYMPSTNTLWVSGEGDKAILEYDLNGNATGRSLAVPSDITGGVSSSNLVFEALAYNANSNLFWTVTEGALARDVDYYSPRVFLRLISFNGETLAENSRRFYLMDAPAKTSTDAKLYVHGVSGMLALDDGRILVLEREIWVPNGSMLDMLKSTSSAKLYLVDPAEDAGAVLSKQLVWSDSKSGLSIANYEGISYGPDVNGNRTVVLVNDAQDYSYLTQNIIVIPLAL